MAPYTEVEVKFIVSDHDAFIEQLHAMGAYLTEERFEHNIRFDTPEKALQHTERVLRLRRIEAEGAIRYVVTVKKPLDIADDKAHHSIRSCHEAEFIIDDPAAFTQALHYLGYQVTWRYEKRRKVYTLNGVEITLDATPIGIISEIEGDPEAIAETVEALGLDMEAGTALSYAELFERVIAHMQLDVADMTFEAFADISVPVDVLKEAAQ